jgi:hypothetical protein
VHGQRVRRRGVDGSLLQALHEDVAASRALLTARHRQLQQEVVGVFMIHCFISDKVRARGSTGPTGVCSPRTERIPYGAHFRAVIQ